MKAKSLKPGLLQALREMARTPGGKLEIECFELGPPLARKPFSAPLSLSTRGDGCEKAGSRPPDSGPRGAARRFPCRTLPCRTHGSGAKIRAGGGRPGWASPRSLLRENAMRHGSTLPVLETTVVSDWV